MTVTVPVSFRDQFRDGFILKSQQKTSRLRGLVRTDPNMLQGRFGYYDAIGTVAMSKRTSRHADVKVIEAAHSRRRITLADYELAQFLDKQDILRMIAGPLGDYTVNAVMAANRQIDDIVIAAADAPAYSIDEDNAATAVALPAGQIIAEGGAGLTIAKMLQVKETLDGAEVDEDEPRYAVISTKQVTNLLQTTEVTSADYNSVKALSEGKVNSFMGFTFIRHGRLKKTGTARRCLFLTPNALGLAIGEDITIDIGPRRDKGNLTQLLVTLSMDATRIEDDKIIAVDCKET